MKRSKRHLHTTNRVPRRLRSLRHYGWSPVRQKVSVRANQGFRFEIRLLHTACTEMALREVLETIRETVPHAKITGYPKTLRRHRWSKRLRPVIYVCSEGDLLMTKMAGLSNDVFRVYELIPPPPENG